MLNNTHAPTILWTSGVRFAGAAVVLQTIFLPSRPSYSQQEHSSSLEIFNVRLLDFRDW